MKKNISNQGIKRPGSTISIASGSEAKKRSRKPVEIPEDAWLDVLKSLSCPKWSKMRLVSRQLNGVVERNVSRLPLAVIDSVAMKLRVIYSTRKQTEKVETVQMIVSDSIISPDDQAEWFKGQRMTIDVPASIQLDNAIIDLRENCNVDLCVLGPSQKEELNKNEKCLPWFIGQQFKTEVLFYAEFSPHRNKYSWASMAFFLKMLHDQSTFVKELSMYSLDKQVKNVLFPDGPTRSIRCGSFTPQTMKDLSEKELCKSMSRLDEYVQADTIHLSKCIGNDKYEFCNFLSSASWRSANQVVKIGRVGNLERFFKALIKKFRTIGTEQCIFPIIVLSGSRRAHDDPLYKLFSENDQESGNSEDDSNDSQSDDNRIRTRNYGDDETYTISNGANRMRIEFIREPEKRNPRRFAYGYDIRVTFEANE